MVVFAGISGPTRACKRPINNQFFAVFQHCKQDKFRSSKINKTLLK
jgi:hypothetical protein